MQGFNMGRYRPPTSDPRTDAFNTTNPLSRRTRPDGALVVRFELPFNVFCAHCARHIAQGVRFNAEKRQVGEYLSSKIWGFTCKCTCGGRFEIRTDPENARYVVGEGAKRQEQEWDPEENGGHPIYDSEAKADAQGKQDAFAVVEKQTKEKSKAKERQKRLEELEQEQERTWSDPYSVNARLRSGFRNEKRARVEQLGRDLELKRRIGWSEESVLVHRTPRSDVRDGKAWEEARRRTRDANGSKAGSASTKTNDSKANSTTAAQRLRTTLVANTVKKQDPFLRQMRTQTQAESRSSSAAAGKRKLVQTRPSSSSRPRDS
ncbi:CWC16 protein [Kalmanozyma brasiliensis GHG001]|uniref:Uncharacterized protein n=1 Tax=Kalmanozyma brasiliensis (strain GHG001) TaxID=1365824 RepID=V5EWX1_KALBG|nr:CWC16 protein [Kalmanozyma brasiliensis GHG001]EST06864.1 CWC16 protein [Kalmanozyma brasiliensis GHG001]